MARRAASAARAPPPPEARRRSKAWRTARQLSRPSRFAPKSTSRHVGKVRRIYAHRGIDRGFDGVRERFKARDEKVILPLSDPRRGVGCGPCVVVRASSRHRSRARWHSRARARRSTARNAGARDAGAARRTSRRPRTRERWREGAAPRAASEDGDDGDDGDDDGADVRGVSARVRRARPSRASGDATAVAKARFDRHGPDGEVVDLSETNFDEVVGRGTPVLVKVYAEWCKHCVALAPVWGEVARELEGELFVGRVDGPKNRLLLKRIGAKAYPTIALFKNGKMYEYESGDRSVAAIVSFARKDYRKTKARGFFHAVWFSKGLRLLYAVPAIGEKAYAYLHGDLRLSNVAILFLTLCVPVMAGMFAIFVADMMICRNVLQETRAMYRNGNRGGGENAAVAAPRRPHFD